MFVGKFMNGKTAVLADQMLVSGSMLLTQLLVVRALGIQEYGFFSVVSLVQLFALSLQQAGITGMYMVVAPGMAVGQRKVYKAGMMAVMIVVALAMLVFAAGMFPVYGSMCSRTAYVMFAAGIPLAMFQDMFRRVLLADGCYRSAFVTDILNNGLQLAGLVALYASGMSSLTAVAVVCTVSYLPAFVYGFRSMGVFPSRAAVKTVFTHSGREALWMTGSALLQWFAGNFYILAAGWWLGVTALGVLRLGQYLFGFLNVILQAVENYLLPKAGAYAGEPARLIVYLKRTQKYMLLVVVGIMLPGLLVVSPVINFLKLDASGELMTVVYGLAIVYLLVVFGYPVRIALRALQHSNVFFGGYVLNAVFGMSTAWILIGHWSLKGVMAGLFLSQVILLSYWLGVLQHKYKVLWK